MSNYGEDELSSDSSENGEDIVEEESSEETSEASDSGEETSDSSDEQEDIDVWAKIQNQAMERHRQEYEVLVDKFRQDGDSEEVADIKANNALLPTYRKELREVLFEELKWMHQLKKDPIYKKIMETKSNFIDDHDYGWEEAMQSAIHQRKFLLSKLFRKVNVPKQNSAEKYHPYARPYGTF